MKILNIFSLYVVFLLCFGCSSETSDYYDYTQSSSIVAKSLAGFINLQTLDSENVNVDIKKDSELDISKVNIFGSFGLNGAQVKLGEISGGSGTYSESVLSILSKLSVNPDSVKVGDNIFLYFDMENANGTARDQNTVVLPFSCPSDLAGVYNSVTTGSSTDDCCKAEPTVNFTSVVTLTKLSDGKYQLSDFSAGLYFHWYVVYGISSTEQSPGKIQDICGDVSIFDTTEPFGTEVTGGGTIDLVAKTITYTWTNGYGDSGTVVLTKQ